MSAGNEIDVPRDRAGSFEPVIVPKGKRRLEGVDRIVLSLTARGLTPGEVAAHFAEVYGANVSKDTISRISDKVVEEMNDWLHRPLHQVYPVVFIDAIVVKVRDGQVVNKPFYMAIGVTVHGERDILGIWAGDGGEGAKFGLNVLTEIKSGGVLDVLILVFDGLKGLPDAVNTVWDKTVVQTCVVHFSGGTPQPRGPTGNRGSSADTGAPDCRKAEGSRPAEQGGSEPGRGGGSPSRLSRSRCMTCAWRGRPAIAL